MKASEILQRNRETIRHAVARHRASNPRVFGSAATGSDDETSDLDLLVDTLPGATLFDLGGLQVELETALGVSIDIVTPDDLPGHFREKVMREALPV